MQVKFPRVSLDWHTPEFWLGVILLVGLILRLLFLVSPLERVVSYLVADDCFYYLNTAYNVAHGHGSSFDAGITQHNGYQPLFLILLVPLYALGIGKGAMVYVALGLLVIASLVAVLYAYRIAVHWGDRWLALCPAAFLALNLYFITLPLRGFETTLALALVLIVIDATLRGRSGWMLGVWLGLAILARVDAVLLALAVSLYLAWHRRWLDIIKAGVVALGICAPWIIWSQVNFGTPLPQSGVSKIRIGNPMGFWHGFEVSLRNLPVMLAGYSYRDYVPDRVLLALGGFIFFWVWKEYRKAGWVLLYALSMFVIYISLTNTKFEFQIVRYLVPAYVVIGIVFFSRCLRPYRAFPVVLVLLLMIGNVKFVDFYFSSSSLTRYPGLCQNEVPDILREIVQEGDVVASFDSGSLGYFSHVPVVNLDGLANTEILILKSEDGDYTGAWHHRYRRYFRENGITILVGADGFSWVDIFPDLESWETLHSPLQTADTGRILFLRVPP